MCIRLSGLVIDEQINYLAASLGKLENIIIIQIYTIKIYKLLDIIYHIVYNYEILIFIYRWFSRR